MKNKCAFCGRSNITLTKEHVLPKCIYERTPEHNLHYLPSDKIVAGAELTIRDVCIGCNGGELSKLDDYFCKLFDTYIANYIRRGEIVKFEYNFDALARWLLKVSYNSARAGKTNYEYLSRFTDYILNNVNRPNGLALFVQLIIPYYLTKMELKTFPRANELRNGNELLPMFTRAGLFELRKGNERLSPGRIFSINSYYFYIFIQPEDVSDKEWKFFIAKVPLLISGATQLKSFRKNMTIKASDENTLTSNLSLVKNNEIAYKKWKSEKGNR